MCPIHDVRAVLYGWKADLCKKRMKFQKYKYNKITTIKDKKKKMEHRRKNLTMKRKTNYTEKRKNKQTTTTTKNTKTRTHRMQNIMRITCAIVLQPIFNAYIFKGSTNFQRLLESPVLYFFVFLFFSPTMHACRCRHTTTLSMFLSFSTSLLL